MVPDLNDFILLAFFIPSALIIAMILLAYFLTCKMVQGKTSGRNRKYLLFFYLA